MFETFVPFEESFLRSWPSPAACRLSQSARHGSARPAGLREVLRVARRLRGALRDGNFAAYFRARFAAPPELMPFLACFDAAVAERAAAVRLRGRVRWWAGGARRKRATCAAERVDQVQKRFQVENTGSVSSLLNRSKSSSSERLHVQTAHVLEPLRHP